MARVLRIAAVLAAAGSVASVAAAARALDTPGAFAGHGISFTYPTTWQHGPGTIQYQLGNAQWTEFFSPPAATPAPSDPSQPAAPPATPGPSYDLLIVAGYRLPVSITKKNLARYKAAIRAGVAQLIGQAQGQILGGPTRVTLGKLPGYRFDTSLQMSDGTLVASRLIFVFRKKIEYFLNCQHTQDGPLTAEIEGGCDQVMQSFRSGS